MSNFFRGKSGGEQSAKFDTVYDPYASLREKYKNELESKIGKTGPKYTGERVAPMSPYEEASLSELERYASSPDTTDTYKLARDEVRRTLSSGVDPTSSPYYQALKASAEREAELGGEALDRQFASGGRFFGGARMKAQTDLAKDLGLGLQRGLAEQIENEAGRRERYAQMAPEFERYETEAPLRKTQALQQYGSLPRSIRQALDDAMYQQFVMEEYDYPMNILQLASGSANQQPTLSQRLYTPPTASPFNQYLAAILRGLQ